MVKLKSLIANLLTLGFVGKIVAYVFSNMIPNRGYVIKTDYPEITDKTKAAIFLGLYEKAERTFVRKYVNNDLDIIELGSSIGVVSIEAGRKLTDRKLICVEPNPNFKRIIEDNLSANGIRNFHVVSAALSSQGDYISFKPGESNIVGKVTNESDKDAIKVKSISLSDIVKDFNVENFALICDIEGAEADLIINDADALHKCRLIIMEVHKSTFNDVPYDVDDIVGLVQMQGFEVRDSRGPVVVFGKSV